MVKIIGVGSLEGDMIDVHLDNGNIIMLELTHKLEEPDFAKAIFRRNQQIPQRSRNESVGD